MAKKLVDLEGKPVLFRGHEIFNIDYTGVVKAVDINKRSMIMVGTDESKDRDGDVIRVSGWNLDNYRKNPVFLWAHNYGSVPLARAEKLVKRKDPPRLEFHLQYPTKGIYPFADMILELYRESIINASSVGFLPDKWENLEEASEEENTRRTFGREFLKQELLELSGCAVPSNPNALQNSLKGRNFGFQSIPVGDIVKWISGNEIIPKPDKADDVEQELEGKIADFEDETTSVQIQVPKEYENVKDCEFCHLSMDDEVIEEKDLHTEYEEVLKPYPNEHACRLKDPGKYDRFARKNCFRKKNDKCIDFIFGVKEGKSEVQALRFPKNVWDTSAARSVCSAEGGSFEAAKDEESTTSTANTNTTNEDMDWIEVTVLEDVVERMYSILSPIREEIKEIKQSILDVSRIVESIAEQVKNGSGTSQVQTNDKGPEEPTKAVSAAEQILADAFASSRKESDSVDPTEGAKLVRAISDLKTVLDGVKYVYGGKAK